MKKSKYRNVKVKTHEHTFDSKAEYRRYQELLILQRAGEINQLELQPKIRCVIEGQHVFTYIADFAYFDCNKRGLIYEDVKGAVTPIFSLKLKLVKALNPHISIVMIKAR
ncbi:MAG: DUF1064 domain-containing protein [Patescibacteria group bacterium]|nr:DUF1064 domain-containing protein [Patescibacteria group bacterium]